jgi:hypothetical protein
MLSSADDVNGTFSGESNALRGDSAKSSEPGGSEIEVEVSSGVPVRRFLKQKKKKKGKKKGKSGRSQSRGIMLEKGCLSALVQLGVFRMLEP